MFNEQEKVKVDNNHDGVILKRHPDGTSYLVKYNKQTGWVQNSRISKAQAVKQPSQVEQPKRPEPSKAPEPTANPEAAE